MLLGGQALRGCVSHSWSCPSGRTPQSANADSSPFRGAMGVAGYITGYKKPMPPLKGRGGPRSGGEVRPRRQRLPIPKPTHTQQNPQGRIPGGLALRGIFLNQIRGRLSGEVTRSDGISTLGNGVAVSLASNHSGGQATRANRGVKLVQVEVMTANC